MWRLANYIYRAFRNVATHRFSEDIIVPITTISNKDDESNPEQKQDDIIKNDKNHIHHVIETNQFSTQNFDKLQKHLYKISYQQLIQKLYVTKPIEAPKIENIVRDVQQEEQILDFLLENDQTSMNTIKNLAQLNEETMSLINNQLAIEALETGDLQIGIETLQISAKDGQNAAALYNLGICYERGIGVEKDRAKACDYYRQASILGHMNAQFNLTLLSNHIDLNDDDNDDEKEIEQTITNKPNPIRFSFANEYKEDQTQLWNNNHFNLTKTLSCLSSI